MACVCTASIRQELENDLNHRVRAPARSTPRPPLLQVIIFAVPGAFTPTCSLKHLPGFIESADVLKSKGVDTVACLSVNDAFVLDGAPVFLWWGCARGVLACFGCGSARSGAGA